MPFTPISTRRAFLKGSAALSGGWLLGFWLPDLGRAADAAAVAATEFAPNAFIRISRTNVVTILVHKAEMGQGISTALPILVAEELEVDLQKIKIVWAPVDPAYNTPGMNAQFTGGSSSVRSEWVRLRQAGATAREMLLAAAAATWGVDRAGLRAENGAVIGPGGKRLTYGQLVDKAVRMAVPTDVPLKDPSQWKLIGKPTRRLDSREKVTGTATFGLDARVPGMRTALIARPPVFGGTVRSVDASRARAVRGVTAVVQLPSGVAVVGRSFWAAKKGRDALAVTWDEGAGAAVDTTAMRAEYAELAKTPGRPASRKGDVDAALAGTANTLTANYDMPYLAHAPMEPLNCLVKLTADRCDIWTGTQNQSVDREHAAKAAGLTPEQVFIHTLYLGGGFGRRANPASDFIVEAVEVAKVTKAPVKVVWTREDDIKGGYYRPMWHSRITAGLDAQGQPVAWKHTIVGQSILEGTFLAGLIKDGVDFSSVEGAREIPYAVPNIAVDLHSPRSPVPVLWWRSVGHTHTGIRGRELHRRVCPRGRQGPGRVPDGAPREPAAAPRRLDPGRREGELGRTAASRPGPRHRRARLLRKLGRPGRGGLPPGRQGPGAPGRLRDRLRHRRQPGDDPGPDGGRHRLRAHGRALRPDQPEGRPRRAGQLPRLSGAAHPRDARGRGPHRAEHGAAVGDGRARHAADGGRRLQRALRAHRPAHPIPAARAARPHESLRASMIIPATVRQLVATGPLAHLTTLNADGSPQVTVVWVGLEDEELLLGHMGIWQKVKNIRRNPRVALSMLGRGKNPMGLPE